MIKTYLKKLWRWRILIIITLAIMTSIGTTVALAYSQQVVVQASVLNIRKGPGLAYDVSAQVKRGQKLTVISKRNEWYQVRISNNQVGWVASWLVKNTEVSATSYQVARVDSNNTPIYLTNSESSVKMGLLQAGKSVTILYTNGSWYQIKHNDSVAWVKRNAVHVTGTIDASAQTEPQNTQTTTQTATNSSEVVLVKTNNTHLRQQPNSNATVVANLAANTKLTYVKTVNQWYQVKTSAGQTGYVASWVVSLQNKSTNNTTTPKVASNLAESTIVLDAGHGGTDSGALSQSDHYEKTYTLQIAKVVASHLRAAGANVIMTRSSDSTMNLSSRATVSNNQNADAFISIHLDSADSHSGATGITTYYYNKNRDTKLATSLNTQLAGLPLKNRGLEFGNFEVLRDNQRPSVLLELGYINNNSDFGYIRSTAYQTEVASAIVNGLTAYFK